MEPREITRTRKVIKTYVETQKEDVDTSGSVDLILVGDVMLGRTVMGKSYEAGDFIYPFRKVASYLNNSDLVFANLENPVTSDCPFTETSMVFCSSPEMISGLKYAGIDTVNLSNNHINNYGNKGIIETIEHLEGANIEYTGMGKLLTKELNGIRLGFLGFNYTYGIYAEKLASDLRLVKDSDSKVDHLIVGVHWGQEYKDIPNELQKDLAKMMISAGADIISGHHPHWIQSVEAIEGKRVYYSLGNFVFDQMWSDKTRTGLVVKLKLTQNTIEEIEKRKVYMSEWAQPEFIE